MKITIAGGTGFIGKALAMSFASSGDKVTVLSRSAPLIPLQGVGYRSWDGESLGDWIHTMHDVDVIINLSGESLAKKRWSESQKKAIMSSRVNATRALVQGCHRAGSRPKVWINGSAVGYYGNVEKGDVVETHPPGSDFLASVCRAWEEEASHAAAIARRLIVLRVGVVLGKGGGALPRMVLPFRLFIGGHLGHGQQWFPWIHLSDLVGIIHFALGHESLTGPVNAVAPESVSNREFSAIIGAVMGRPSWAHVPAMALRFFLGEMSDMLLTGQKVVPHALLASGYRFQFPTLRTALARALH